MNGRKTLLSFIAFAFLTRLLLLLYFPLQHTDYYIINSAAKNLADGHGMGFVYSSANDLSNYYFEGLRLWPPLVTFITGLFLKLTGSIIVTDFILVILLLIFLFLAIHKIFDFLKISTPYRLAAYLLLAINPDLIKQPGFSDLAAATFCLWACIYCCNLITSQSTPKKRTLILSAVLFFLPSAFRYQFYPMSIFFPFSILTTGIILNDRTTKKQGLFLLLCVSALIISQETFLLQYTAQPISQSVSMDSRGFYLSNLSFIYPFFLKSFVYFSYIENRYPYILNHFGAIYSIFAIGLFLLWLYLVIVYLIKKYAHVKNDLDRRNLISIKVLLLTTIIPPLILFFLSISHNSRNGIPGGWTYVKEGRYYLLPSLLILIITIWYIQMRVIYIRRILKKAGLVILTTSIVYHSTLTCKFYYNILTHNIPDKEVELRAERNKIEWHIDELSKSNYQTVICSQEPYFAYFSFKPKVAVTQKPSELFSKPLRTTKSIQMLLIVQRPITKADSLLIAQARAKEITSLSTTTLFLAYIYPATTK